MKIALVLLLFPVLSFAQKPLSYSGIVQVDSISKDELFTRARAWLNESFVSAKNVTQIADKETGELSAKGDTKLTAKYRAMGAREYEMRTHFTINIWVRDGRYKYEIKNFEPDDTQTGFSLGLLTDEEECPIKRPGSKKVMQDIWESMKIDAEKTANRLSDSLETAMKKKKTEDW